MPVLLLLASSALAHRPHAVVSALVAPADFQSRGRAWLVHTPGDACQLLVTDDFGAHWSSQGGALQADGIVDLGEAGGTLYALAQDGTVWISTDEGEAWTAIEPTSLPSRSLAVGPSGFAIATVAGVWVGTSLDALSSALASVPLDEVAWSVEGDLLLARADGAGDLYRGGLDGDMTALTALPDEQTVSGMASVDGEIWVGSESGVWRWADPTWEACGALGTLEDAWDERVTELRALPDGRLVAATTNTAYFVSSDGCASWTHVNSGLEATFGGIGGVDDLDETYVDLIVGDTHQVVAGFDGVAWSEDGGDTWLSAPIVASDRVRGLALAPGFPITPRVMFGTYGGGAVWSDDGGLTWEGSSAGLRGPYNFDVAFDPAYADNQRVWWAGGEPDNPAYSDDGGTTWVTFSDVAVGMGYGRVGDQLWLFGRTDDGVGLVMRREGEEWTHLSALTEALAGSAPHHVAVDDDGRLFVSTDRDAALYLSEDDGDTWTLVQSWDGGFTSGLALHGQTILQATYEGGLHRSADGGASWTTVTEPVPHPQVLTVADDGTFFLAGGDGQVWRSTDDGVSWDEVGPRMRVSPSALVTQDQFALTRGLFLGTSRGVYWSQDAGETWGALPRFQRFAMSGRSVTCTGTCTTWDQGDGGIPDAWELTPADSLSVSFEGEQLRIVSEALAGDPAWTVEIDGTPATTDPDGEWLVTGLSGGWHDAVVRVTGGEARFHAAEVLLSGEPVPLDAGEPGPAPHLTDPDCGCGAGGAAWIILPLVGVSRRRARRG